MASQGNGSRINVCNRVVLGNFSVDEHGKYCNDDRNRKYFVRPDDEPDFDLTEGREEFIPYNEYGPRMLDSLQLWIKDHREELKEQGVLQKLPESSHWR